jgi:hypothetical protein
LSSYQLEVAIFEWEEGPRLKMKLKLFPNNTGFFNSSEVLRLRDMFTGWLIADSDIFGPYELIDFIPGWYENGTDIYAILSPINSIFVSLQFFVVMLQMSVLVITYVRTVEQHIVVVLKRELTFFPCFLSSTATSF